MDISYLLTLALLIFGFGFVIFWHELGHFLAAKWAGVRVEQFAVGFGHAIISWRKGVGVRRGSSRKEYEGLLRKYLHEHEHGLKTTHELSENASEERKLEYASKILNLGETEYRLNWIPLGGYVKMLGQDDIDPTARSDSPRSYNNKPIGKRMVIVSAGVIMNIILAIILFTVLFRMGFHSPPALVGLVSPGSPAQHAGIQVGDKILTINERIQHDFTKIGPNVALAETGQPLQVTIEGRREPITVIPRKSAADPNGFLQLGIMAMPSLRGPDPKKLTSQEIELLKDEPLRPGETIVAVNGQPVGPMDYPVLDRAIQQGKPVDITVEDAQGQRHQRQVKPMFIPPFDDAPLQFAGMAPRTVVAGVEPWSSAKDKLQSGDIIDEVVVQPANDLFAHPATKTLMKVLNRAGQGGSHVDIKVLRDGKLVDVTGLDPSKKVGENRRGLGIGLSIDVKNAVVADVVSNSAAQRAGIPPGATIESIGGQPVQGWRDVQRLLSAAEADTPLSVAFVTRTGQQQTVEMRLTADQLAEARQNRYTSGLALRELTDPPRQTKNPFTAAAWGIGETRDLMVQFYLTLRRMAQGSVSPRQAMGPIGIFHHGSKIAYRGTDWVIWFLAMISANLAVVNFLPVPIVDGGLFLFLILEKIMGKPLSPRAQGIAQLVGLALIAGVFLFVTYNDITRLF